MPITTKLSVVYTILGILVGASIVIGILSKWVRTLFKLVRRANETIDALQEIILEWRGTPPRNGDPGMASMPVRMANVERAVATVLARQGRRI